MLLYLFCYTIKDLLDNRGDLVRGLCLNRAGVKLGIGGGESMTVEATVTYRAHQLQVGGGTHRVHVLEAGAEVRVAKGSGTFSVPDSFPVTCAFWVRGDNHHQEGGEEKLILPGENKLAEFNLRKDGQDRWDIDAFLGKFNTTYYTFAIQSPTATFTHILYSRSVTSTSPCWRRASWRRGWT